MVYGFWEERFWSYLFGLTSVNSPSFLNGPDVILMSGECDQQNLKDLGAKNILPNNHTSHVVMVRSHASGNTIHVTSHIGSVHTYMLISFV
jgi:hypothetical protein